MENVLELLKTNWKKYSLITLVSSGISSLVAYNSQDRKDSIAEMGAYNKYVTELIVLNKSPDNRVKLAEYFSTVSPSCFSRYYWCNYLEKAKQEKKIFDENYRLLKDSLLRFEERIDSKSNPLSFRENFYYKDLKASLDRTDKIKNEPLQSVTTQTVAQPISSKMIYFQANATALDKAKELAMKLNDMGFKIPVIENMSDDKGQKTDIKTNELRYFNTEDQEIVQQIFETINPLVDNNLKIIFNPRYSQSKNIEVWLK